MMDDNDDDIIEDIVTSMTNNGGRAHINKSTLLYDIRDRHQSETIVTAVTEKLLQRTFDDEWRGTMAENLISKELSKPRRDVLNAILRRLKREFILSKFIIILQQLVPADDYINALYDGDEKDALSRRGVRVEDVPSNDEKSRLRLLKHRVGNLSVPLDRILDNYLRGDEDEMDLDSNDNENDNVDDNVDDDDNDDIEDDDNVDINLVSSEDNDEVVNLVSSEDNVVNLVSSEDNDKVEDNDNDEVKLFSDDDNFRANKRERSYDSIYSSESDPSVKVRRRSSRLTKKVRYGE